MLEIFSGTLRIAVVDDVETQAQFVQAILQECVKDGVYVDFYTSPKEALEEIAKGRYFAVFTDVHMEEMHGDDLVRAINKMNLGVKTYVLTGDDGFILALNCFCLGCRNIFVKPPKRDLLQKAAKEIEAEFDQWRQVFHDLQQKKKVTSA